MPKEVSNRQHATIMLTGADQLFLAGPGEGQSRVEWKERVAHLRQTGTGFAILALLDLFQAGLGTDGTRED